MRNSPRARYDIVDEIFKKMDSDPSKHIHYLYKNTLRYLINKFSNINYIDGNNNSIRIKCYHANPERAIGIIFNESNVVLPVITVSENSTSIFDKKQRYTSLLIDEKYWHPKFQRAIRIVSLPPRPVTISYSLNLWSFYKNDLDQMREIIFSMFNPDLNITVNGGQLVKVFIDSEEDDSEIKVSDKEDRVLQKSINLTLETFMPSSRFLYTSTGKIEKLNFEFEFESGKIAPQTVAQLESVLTSISESEAQASTGSGGTGGGAAIDHTHEQYVTPEELQAMTWLTN